MRWWCERALFALAVTCASGEVLAQIAGAEYVPALPVAPGEVAVDGVVAVMELEGDDTPQFVSRSELELLVRVELGVRGAPEAFLVPVHESVRVSVLEQLVGERLVVREAERAGEGVADSGALAAEHAWMEARMASQGGREALLRATGATREELDALVRRRVVATRYLVSHHARTIEPTEVELRRAHQSGRYAALVGAEATLAEARRGLREVLVRAALPASERQFLRSLGSRARLRVFTEEHGAELSGAGA